MFAERGVTWSDGHSDPTGGRRDSRLQGTGGHRGSREEDAARVWQREGTAAWGRAGRRGGGSGLGPVWRPLPTGCAGGRDVGREGHRGRARNGLRPREARPDRYPLRGFRNRGERCVTTPSFLPSPACPQPIAGQGPRLRLRSYYQTGPNSWWRRRWHLSTALCRWTCSLEFLASRGA